MSAAGPPQGANYSPVGGRGQSVAATAASVGVVQSAIVIEGVAKTFRRGNTETRALERIDLTVHDGEFVAIVGKSGSGKSTLLNLVGGIDSPTSGAVEVGGTAIQGLDQGRLAVWRGRNVGFVFQFFNLIPILSAIDNAALPLVLDGKNGAESKQKATDWLTRVGLGARLHPRRLARGARLGNFRALVALAVRRRRLARPDDSVDSQGSGGAGRVVRQVRGAGAGEPLWRHLWCRFRRPHDHGL